MSEISAKQKQEQRKERRKNERFWCWPLSWLAQDDKNTANSAETFRVCVRERIFPFFSTFFGINELF